MPLKDHDIIIEISSDMKYVKKAMDDIRETYATKEEVCGVRKELKSDIAPIKAITFGLVGAISLAVLYALVATVLVKAY